MATKFTVETRTARTALRAAAVDAFTAEGLTTEKAQYMVKAMFSTTGKSKMGYPADSWTDVRYYTNDRAAAERAADAYNTADVALTASIRNFGANVLTLAASGKSYN